MWLLCRLILFYKLQKIFTSVSVPYLGINTKLLPMFFLTFTRALSQTLSLTYFLLRCASLKIPELLKSLGKYQLQAARWTSSPSPPCSRPTLQAPPSTGLVSGVIPTTVKTGIIGGTGLDDPEISEGRTEKYVDTPFGKSSDVLILGKIKNVGCVFLARHGRWHTIMPSKVSYQANIGL